MENLVYGADILSFRDLTRLVLLSGLFTLVCMMAFPRNASSRRFLLLAGVTALVILPWFLAYVPMVWFVTVSNVPQFTLAAYLPNFLVAVWLSVAMVLCWHHYKMVQRELKEITHLRPIVDERIARQVLDVCQGMNMTQVPQVLLGEHACSTSRYGGLIVLPASYLSWDKNTQRSVLAHELVHIQRRDDLWLNFLKYLILLYWWMPWLKGMYHSYIRAMEESCDDQAATFVGQQHKYAAALADAAGIKACTDVTPPAGYQSVANLHQHHLVGRIGRFNQLRELELNSSAIYWCVIGILGVVTVITGIEPITARTAATVDVDTHVHHLPIVARNSTSTFPATAQHNVIGVQVDQATRARLLNPIYEPPLVYPGQAIRQGKEGVVVVEFGVTEDGGITGAKVLSAYPEGVFNEVALRSVNKSRYAPAYANSVTAANMYEQAITTSRPKQVAQYGAASMGSNTRPSFKPTRIQRHFKFRLERH